MHNGDIETRIFQKRNFKSIFAIEENYYFSFILSAIIIHEEEIEK